MNKRILAVAACFAGGVIAAPGSAYAAGDDSAAGAPDAVIAPAAATNFIINDSPLGLEIGVIEKRDGDYQFGNYDWRLPEGQSTDLWLVTRWSTTAGWYTGPGYCTKQWRSENMGSTWTRQKPNLGPGQHFIGATTSYDVYAYRAYDSNCADDA